MAEAMLYSNFAEPSFPFNIVAPKLTWLPAYLSALELDHQTTSTFPAILDTIFVFARARTSALHSIEDFAACKSLASLLNAELETIGGETRKHRLELVRRGRDHFFITCKESPRFNWKAHLTHLEVGRNLDYFAAGHIFDPPYPPRGLHQFVERSSMKRLFAEYVSLERLRDQTVQQEMRRFNKAKENLFNLVMESFKLPYRFKWVFITQDQAERARVGMLNNITPSEEWWEDNCVFANGAGIPGVPPTLELFSFTCRFRKYWPLIQYIYEFLPQYFQNPTLALPEYTAAGRRLFDEIRRVLNHGMMSEKLALDGFKARLDLHSQNRYGQSEPTQIVESKWSRANFKPWLNKIGYVYRLFCEEIKLRSFERWKLREPLAYSTVFNALDSKAYELLF